MSDDDIPIVSVDAHGGHELPHPHAIPPHPHPSHSHSHSHSDHYSDSVSVAVSHERGDSRDWNKNSPTSSSSLLTNDSLKSSDIWASLPPIDGINLVRLQRDGVLEHLSTQKLRERNNLVVIGAPFSLFMLLCIMFLTFGSYWCYDLPGALEDQFKEHFGNDTDGNPIYTNGDNTLLYSIYSWPNTILAFFGGIIIDKYTGVRWGATIFSILITIGQVLFALGVEVKAYWLMVFGRFVFGLGGESLTVAQNTYTVRWFDGKLLALAFGLVVAFARVGSSVNFAVSSRLANDGLSLAMWVSTGMVGISLLATLLAAWADWWGDKKCREARDKLLSSMNDAQRSLVKVVDEDPTSDEVNLKDILKFPLDAWILYFICLFFYQAVLTFLQVASDILQNTGAEYSSDDASLFLACVTFVAIFASPLFGKLVDVKGRALTWIAVASLGLVIGHAVFIGLAYDWYEFNPVPITIWIGINYSLGAAAMWPILSFIVDKKLLGTAYGCMTAVQNTGMAIFPLIIGQIQDRYQDGEAPKYTIPIFIFIGCSGVSFILTMWLAGRDAMSGGRLNSSAKERAEFLKKLAEKQTEQGSPQASQSLSVDDKDKLLHNGTFAAVSPSGSIQQ